MDFAAQNALIFSLSVGAWLISTLSAGGAGLVFLAVGNLFLSATVTPVILSVTGMVSGAYRTGLYWRDIDWKIIGWLLPGTLIGSVAGASLFSSLVTESSALWIQGFLGAFLVISSLMELLKVRVLDLSPRLFWFFPFGLASSFFSGLVGAVGPITNVLFQKFPLSPMQIVGTKSFNVFVLQACKSLTFGAFLILPGSGLMAGGGDMSHLVILCLFSGIGAMVGSHLGKTLLHRMQGDHFLLILNVTLLLAGAGLIWQAVAG